MAKGEVMGTPRVGPDAQGSVGQRLGEALAAVFDSLNDDGTRMITDQSWGYILHITESSIQDLRSGTAVFDPTTIRMILDTAERDERFKPGLDKLNAVLDEDHQRLRRALVKPLRDAFFQLLDGLEAEDQEKMIYEASKEVRARLLKKRVAARETR
jgi:hypothetical protein